MKLLITYNGRDGITKCIATQTEPTTLVDDHNRTWAEDATGRWWFTDAHGVNTYAMSVIVVEK